MIAPHDCYGGTLSALQRFGTQPALPGRVHRSRPIPKLLRAALCAHPATALGRDAEQSAAAHHRHRAVARLAQACGALVVVDNTFLSPGWQRPIELGADLVVHSTTKYLNGHSDVVGGAVVARDVGLHEQLAWWANCLGVTGSPFDSYLTLRGLRTLHVAAGDPARENAACTRRSAAREPPAMARVYYPGLVTHPGHALAAAPATGFGAMISFELAGWHHRRAKPSWTDSMLLARRIAGRGREPDRASRLR